MDIPLVFGIDDRFVCRRDTQFMLLLKNRLPD